MRARKSRWATPMKMGPGSLSIISRRRSGIATAAQKGDPEAQNGLGVMYRLGSGVEKDPQEAMDWYRKAAKQGYAPAMLNIAASYYTAREER